MPIWNWYKVHETGNFVYLFREWLSEKKEFDLKTRQWLYKKWEEIHDEYLAKFGIGEKFEDVIRRKKNIMRMTVQRIVNSDTGMDTLIAVEKLRLQEIESAQQKADFYEVKAIVEKMIGFAFDAKKMVVAEFYSHLKQISKENGK